jgi:hypothetical protein
MDWLRKELQEEVKLLLLQEKAEKRVEAANDRGMTPPAVRTYDFPLSKRDLSIAKGILGNVVADFLAESVVKSSSTPKVATKRKRSVTKVTPEDIGRLLGFLVPRIIRNKCFEPYFEDLKADRLEKLARKGSRGVKRWIDFCFYLRLCVTVVQSLFCYLGETLSKLAPFIRALFFKSGS